MTTDKKRQVAKGQEAKRIQWTAFWYSGLHRVKGRTHKPESKGVSDDKRSENQRTGTRN